MLQGPRKIIKHARSLRRETSLPEVLLWQALRKRPAGLKFRHQHPAGPYVADFFCHKARLVLEVDGEAHERGDRPERDAARDAWFAARRFHVFRIPAAEVLANLDGVMSGIVARCVPPNPPLKGEGDQAQWAGRHLPRTWLRSAGHCAPAHGGGVSASERDTAANANPQAPAPLHPLPAAGGPPPLRGEDS